MIDHAAIAALIPHAGRMVLLDAVVSWDATRIVCRSRSHRAADNPLAQQGRLDSLCGLEYAGQAMALHGALTQPAGGAPRSGFLASVRDVVCHIARLDPLDELTIAAEQLHAEAGRVIYAFTVIGDGAPALTGRAAVVLGEPAP